MQKINMPNSIDKILDLAKKTNSNIIVLNANQEPAYVIMDFEAFERLGQNSASLASLSEEQLLDKVNSEIASWKAANKGKEFEDWTEIAEKEVEKKPEENQKNWLNSAKKVSDDIKSAQDYFFEPVD